MSCERIALWEPPYVLPDARPPVPADYADQMTLLAKNDDTAAMVELFMTAAVGMPAQFLDELKQSPGWDFLQATANPALVYDAQMAGDFSIPSDQVTHVTCPVLILDRAPRPGSPRPPTPSTRASTRPNDTPSPVNRTTSRHPPGPNR